ncbi:MAG TPA: permease prefix domain 1-containing protein [Acidimicrobiia bacterium]|nr:permease prefix domain 1-containing protein [Acidimicrobiia bacterium]
MTELTDRYVDAALRSIPEKQRGDIEAELRASIGDAVDARTASGEDLHTAERGVLTELGDPDRLAAGYVGRPGYLIGPDYFFDYKRLLTVLLVTVLPIVVVVIAVLEWIGGGDVGDVFGSAFSIGIALVVHMAFWTTLVFALIERSEQKPPAGEWTLANLPAVPTRATIKLGETIAAVVFLVLAIAAMIVSRTVSPVTSPDGSVIPLFDPAMWDFWFPFLIGVLLVEIVFELVKYRVGHWTWGLASFNLALNAAFAIPAIYLLATDQMLNPVFFAEIGWTPGGATISLAIAAIAIVSLWDTVDGFRRAYKGG